MEELPAWLREKGGHRGRCDLVLPVWFWSIIDQVRADPLSVLGELSFQQLSRFYYTYREATDELYGDYRDDERGWTEEDILSASSWVVNQGEGFYRAVWEDLRRYPEPSQVPRGDLSGLAAQIARERFGKELCG